MTVFDVELFTKRWEMLMTPEEIAKVSHHRTASFHSVLIFAGARRSVQHHLSSQ